MPDKKCERCGKPECFEPIFCDTKEHCVSEEDHKVEIEQCSECLALKRANGVEISQPCLHAFKDRFKNIRKLQIKQTLSKDGLLWIAIADLDQDVELVTQEAMKEQVEDAVDAVKKAVREACGDAMPEERVHPFFGGGVASVNGGIAHGHNSLRAKILAAIEL